MNALVNYPQQYEEAAVRLQAESFRASQLHKKIETICELSQLESADILNSIQTLSKERKAIEVKLESVLRLGKPTNSAIRNLKNAAKWAGGGKRRFEDGLLTLRILYDALFSAIPQSNLLAKSPEINQEQQRLHDLASEIVELSGNPHEDPENIPLSEFTTTSPFSTYRIGLNDGETEPRSVSRSTSLSGSWSASRSALRTITIYEGSPSPSSCQKSRSIQSRHPLFETLYDIALQGLKFVAKTLECKDVVELVDRLQIWGLGLFQGPLALDSIFLSEEQYENILFTNPKVLRTCFLKVILNIGKLRYSCPHHCQR
jgi:hypothetical protein